MSQTYQITVKMEGISELKAALQHVNVELYKETMNILVEEMTAAVQESQAEASSRGWRLASQIMLGMIDPDNLVVEGGSFAPHSGFPEFGTIYQHAQPFWRPFVWNHWFIVLRRLNETGKRLWTP